MDEEIQQITAIYHMIVEFFVTYSFQLVGAVLIIILDFGWAEKLPP